MLPLSPREKKSAWAILVAFLLCITLPYVWAWAITPPGFTWGGLLFSADDQNVHLAWARQAQDGAFFLRDLFTTESLISGARPLFFNALALAIGWMSRLSGLEVGVSYHILRVAGAAWALWQLHLLAWAVTRGAPDRENARLWTLALAAFTTGAGFLGLVVPALMSRVIFLDRPDTSFTLVPEAFFSLSALIYPLNIISYGLLMLVFRHILDGKWWPAALAALLLANIHTYDALPLGLIALIWAVANWRGERAQAKRALAVVAGAALPVLYQIVVFRDSEEFRVKALNPTLPPPVGHVIVTMAPLLLLAPLGWLALRSYRRESALMALWAVVVALLIYVPGSVISFARKMIEGGTIPLLVLGGAGLASFKKPLVAGAIVALLAVSPVLTTAWILDNAAENNGSRLQFYMPVLYLYNSEVAALHFISQSSDTGAVVCMPWTGAYVPRATGKTVYAGHWAETLHFYDQKLPNVESYFKGEMSPAQARDWLRKNRIRWVMEGPFERTIAHGAHTSVDLGLERVFQNGTGDAATNVYRVN